MEQKMELTEIPMGEIHADQEFNCRGPIAPIDVVELARDIAEHGLVQPITITTYPEDKAKVTGYKYLLVAGYRRHMAFRVNDKSTIPCIINNTLNGEVDIICLNLSENTQRKDLNILQESHTIKKLMDLGLTETQIQKKLQKARGWVQVRYMLMTLHEDIQSEAAAGVFTQQNIRDLYTVNNQSGKQECFDQAKKIKEHKQRGEKIISNPKIKSVESKKHRGRAEIFLMMDHVKATIDMGFHTRILAWCAGEISTGDLYDNIGEYAEEQGLEYTRPEKLGD